MINLRKNRLYLIIIFIVAVLSACTSYKTPVRNSNVSFIYNPSSTSIHPEYKVYHNEDSSSTVFIHLNVNELLYIKKLNNQKPEAQVQVHYKLYNSLQQNNIQDSATHVFYIEKDTNLSELNLDIKINAKQNNTYILDIITTDLIRGKGNQHFIEVDKRNDLTAQNFLVISKETQEPIFINYLNSSIEFNIKHKNSKNKKLYVKQFNGKFKMPSPPFSVSVMKSYTIKPDTTWDIILTDTTVFTLNEYGMYNFSLDTAYKSGLTLFNFGTFFPEIKTANKLIEPIQYLTTSREFNEYSLFENKKEAVDNFWLKSSGNFNRAKELIRVYYNRAKFANMYFSSFTEGWRTDRGMLYMIYGVPNTIYKSDNQERWIYGTSQSIQALSYTFIKVENPYTDNDYILSRSEIYKLVWYQAIDSWRNGRVFSIVK